MHNVLPESWIHVVPLLYRDTDLNKLPASNSDEAIEKCNQWIEYSEPWIMIWGDCRQGKSRLAWHLYAHRTMARMTNITIDSIDFDLMVRSALGYRGDAMTLIREYRNCDILFIDDIGKAKITQKTGEILFNVIDKRMQRKEIMIFTSNYAGNKLVNRFDDPDTGVAIIERIREWMTIHMKTK